MYTIQTMASSKVVHKPRCRSASSLSHVARPRAQHLPAPYEVFIPHIPGDHCSRRQAGGGERQRPYLHRADDGGRIINKELRLSAQVCHTPKPTPCISTVSWLTGEGQLLLKVRT